MYDELGQLLQGNKFNNIKGTNTAYFVHPNTIPKDQKVAYIRIVVDICPQKAVPECVRPTIGGNGVDYFGEVTTQTAYLTTVKLHLNSVISTSNGKFLGIDINNFSLDTSLDNPEYAA